MNQTGEINLKLGNNPENFDWLLNTFNLICG